MENNFELSLKNLITSIEKEFDREILAIIYNPSRPEGINDSDLIFLMCIIENSSLKNPIIILRGHGGSFNAAISMANLFSRKFSSYKICIPEICSSALCLLFFKAESLILLEKSCLTQIDPKFEYNGEELRAIKQLNSLDPELRNKSHLFYNYARDELKKLIETSSIFKFETLIKGEFEHMENIICKFMNKEDHASEITLTDLDEVEVKYEILSDMHKRDLFLQLVEFSEALMLKENSRVIFISSKPINYFPDFEGMYVCPLN